MANETARRDKVTFLISSHDLSLFSNPADSCLLLFHGRIICRTGEKSEAEEIRKSMKNAEFAAYTKKKGRRFFRGIEKKNRCTLFLIPINAIVRKFHEADNTSGSSDTETEITIRCARMDSRLEQLAGHIRQFGFSLTGYQEDKEFQLPLEKIFFMDSADGRTYLYLGKEVYYCRETLASLEARLSRTSFTRISKSCLVNTSFLQSVRPLYNHRLEATLQNGEKLVITRNYIEPLKEKLKGANV